MSDVMKYKDYTAKVSYDAEAKLFHGQVIGMNDVVTFQGRSVDELEKALEESIEDYLAMCKEDSTNPQKSFSGNFPVRTTPEIHDFLYTTSRILGLSLGDTVGLMTNFFVIKQNFSKPELLASELDRFRKNDRREAKFGT
jgi:predicted HicB family RNase H-like nuclease